MQRLTHSIPVQQRIIQFRADFEVTTQGRALDTIYNIDQSGFNPEQLSRRTLEVRGTKKVFSIIRSTHSAQYTAQFIISASGELLKPVFMILRDVGGVFDERVAQCSATKRSFIL